MKKFLVSATLLMSVAAFSAFAEEMTGYIADSTCAAKGKGGSEAHADCAAKCIKGGAAPVFVVGDKVYKIANTDTVTAHAGHKVTINGDVEGDTVTVKSVKM
ncbi:MAG: hypothetical protein JWO80_463 [Bryobacterales bacterium]|nr:hypothetical protein [Bryobacterales bacterium]